MKNRSPKESAKSSPFLKIYGKELVKQIERDVLLRDTKIQWEDIAGLSEVKEILKEAAVLPMLVPTFFKGLRKPCQGVLLYGPPVTGKTTLANVLATEGKVPFFNVSAASFTSSRDIHSEKMVQLLFDMARSCSPCVIFLDELDCLLPIRGSRLEDSSRRPMLSAFITQIESINDCSDASHTIILLGATNCPWDVDEALMRRLEKKVYVPLPDQEARVSVLQKSTKDLDIGSDVNFSELAKKLKGYSNADINLVCREAR